MRQAKDIRDLSERLREALERLDAALAENQAVKEQLDEAHKRLEELEKQTPAFVKAPVVKSGADLKKARKRRDPRTITDGVGRVPMRVVEHAIKDCPVCAGARGGLRVARRRPVSELPAPPAVEVSEHVV